MATQELLDYIKQQSAQGVNSDQIRNSLVANGWQEGDINEAFILTTGSNNNQSPRPTTPQPPILQSIITVLPGAPALLKEALSIYKERLGIFLGIMAIELLVSFIFSFVLLMGGFLASLGKVSAIILTATIFLLTFFISAWGSAALIYAIKDKKEHIGIIESYRRGLHKIFSLWWVLLLMGLIVLGGFLLFIIPGIIFWIWFSLAIFVLFAEDVKGMNALLKSKEYVKGKWGSVFWRGLFLSLCMIPLLLLVGLLLSGIPDTSWIKKLVNTSFSLFLTPLGIIYAYLIYYYLRSLKGEIVFAPTKGQKIGFSFVAILGLLAIASITLLISFGFLSKDKMLPVPQDIKPLPEIQTGNTSAQLNPTPIKDKVSPETIAIKSGGAIGFTLEKSPAGAAQWLLQVKCPNGVGGLVVPVIDGKPVAAEIIQCNSEKTLLHSPITFQAKFTNITYGDKTATIISRTSDSAGVLLNEETLSVVIKGDIDAYTKALISNVRAPAEIYYDSNGNSYAGVCASTKSAQNYDSVSDAYNKLLNLSGSVVCNDSSEAWAMSAQLKDSPSKYFCSDSTGVAIERNSPITTISCK